MSPAERARREEYVARVVAASPPLTDRQKVVLRQLLRSAGGTR